jgi:hypothetical protein
LLIRSTTALKSNAERRDILKGDLHDGDFERYARRVPEAEGKGSQEYIEKNHA